MPAAIAAAADRESSAAQPAAMDVADVDEDASRELSLFAIGTAGQPVYRVYARSGAEQPVSDSIAVNVTLQVLRNPTQGMWRDLPEEMPALMDAAFIKGSHGAVYTWDWGSSRAGAWKPEGEEPSISRYQVDFRPSSEGMTQKNIDTGCKRKVRRVFCPA